MKKWNELPYSVRMSRRRLYNYIYEQVEGTSANTTNTGSNTSNSESTETNE